MLDTVVTANMCNDGDVPFVISGSRLEFGSWLTLVDDPAGDTLLPGECVTVTLRSEPLDTGLLVDTIWLSSCDIDFALPVEQVSIDRDLSVLIDLEDFGDVCIGEARSKQLAVMRNNDSIDVTINSVFVEGGLKAQFRVANGISDLVIPAFGTLEVEVEFQPRRLGLDTGRVVIRYADQRIVARTVRVTGRGSGADIQLSHSALPFIPEITERTIVVHNRSINSVTIEEATITVGEPFTLLTPAPIEIPGEDSVMLRIRYDGGTVGADASLSMTVQPCASDSRVRLAAYSGTASVEAPEIFADPSSDTTSIPIKATISESVAYKGVRFFEGVLKVNPRLYLAREVTSTIGVGEIVSQEIIGDKRHIHFRIEGSFSGIGEIGRIVGYVGMAEVDTSLLEFDVDGEGFGSSVVTTYQSGILRILHEDPTRRIVDRQTAPIIQRIVPTPANDWIEVTVASIEPLAAMIRVVDQQGVTLLEARPYNLSAGNTTIQIDVTSLPIGVHVAIVETALGTSVAQLVVVR